MATAVTRGSASISASASASSIRRSITAVRCAAFTARAPAGLASVTRPAPARSAAPAASRAAPVRAIGPETHHRVAAAVLVVRRAPGRDRRAAQSDGAFSKVRGAIASSTESGMPMSARVSRPQRARPG